MADVLRGKPSKNEKKNFFYNYIELKNVVRKLNIKTKEEYLKAEKDGKMPSNPNDFYMEWEGWSIFLRDEIYKKKYNNTYYDYETCKSVVQKLDIKSSTDWFNKIIKLMENDIRIPYDPYVTYKDWETWGIFLGTGNVYSNEQVFLSFEESKNVVRKLGITSVKEFRETDNSLLVGVSKTPDRRYKKDWLGWNDWFGCDVIKSTGEKYITDILNELNIKFTFNNSFKDCKYKHRLRFDFRIEINGETRIIEFDGVQHFTPMDRYGGEDGFTKTKIRDDIKNKWCSDNNIPFLRINYKLKYHEIKESVLSFVS